MGQNEWPSISQQLGEPRTGHASRTYTGRGMNNLYHADKCDEYDALQSTLWNLPEVVELRAAGGADADGA